MERLLVLKPNIKPENLISISTVDKNTVNNAQLIIDNQFFLRPNLEVIDFTKGINWDYIHKVGANTYQLYLHSLDPISVLCNAYRVTKNDMYLKKSIDILNSWNDYQLDNNDNKMIWSDHSTAARTITLSNLLVLLTKNKVSFEYNLHFLENTLLNNIDFLYLDDVYKRNNHGIMMDRALLQASIIFQFHNSTSYLEKALYRIKDNFYNSFSSKGTHLENSPEYHLLVQRLFQSVEDLLQQHDLTLGTDVTNLLKRSNEYYGYITKPNHFLPLIGDTKKINMTNITKNFKSFFDSEAGIAVLQSENKNKSTDSIWLSFIAGYSSLVHKHFDDLSFSLYYNGYDIFVDSGQHSYSNSKERLYVKSAKAHNTITIDKENYVLYPSDEAKDKIKMTDYTSNPIYDFVKGVNLGYKSTEITRSLLFIKSGIIILFDKILSDVSQNISQHFNLAPHIRVASKDKNKTILNSSGTEIMIEQLNGVDKLIVHRADNSKPYAIMSERFGTTTDISQLEYIKECKDDFFLTIISLNNNNSLNNIQFDPNSNRLTFELDFIPYSLIL